MNLNIGTLLLLIACSSAFAKGTHPFRFSYEKGDLGWYEAPFVESVILEKYKVCDERATLFSYKAKNFDRQQIAKIIKERNKFPLMISYSETLPHTCTIKLNDAETRNSQQASGVLGKLNEAISKVVEKSRGMFPKERKAFIKHEGENLQMRFQDQLCPNNYKLSLFDENYEPAYGGPGCIITGVRCKAGYRFDEVDNTCYKVAPCKTKFWVDFPRREQCASCEYGGSMDLSINKMQQITGYYCKIKKNDLRFPVGTMVEF